MTEESTWEKNEALELLGKRGLNMWYPALRSHLYPGAKVLDVGCGPGPITLDIAADVYPGSVVGVDSAEKTIDRATALAEHLGVENVVFQVGDAYCLEFADGTFDITYSSNLLVWLREPVRALEEQKRVTRKGGWVAAGIGDWGTIVIYPPCPAFEKWLAALHHLNDPSDPTESFVNFNLGREAVALFSHAGLREIEIEACVTSRECVYPGSEHFDARYSFFRTVVLDPETRVVRKLLELGVLDEETVLAAQKELDAWYGHPCAFFMETSVLAAGKVT